MLSLLALTLTVGVLYAIILFGSLLPEVPPSVPPSPGVPPGVETGGTVRPWMVLAVLAFVIVVWLMSLSR